MRIRIDHLQQGRLALEFEQPADRFPALRRVTANADGNFTGPVRASVTAERVGEMVEIRGQVRATASAFIQANIRTSPVAASWVMQGIRPRSSYFSEDGSKDIGFSLAAGAARLI